jgi:hypothetical protein
MRNNVFFCDECTTLLVVKKEETREIESGKPGTGENKGIYSSKLGTGRIKSIRK